MKVHYGFDSLPAFRAPVVTVGSYDGVHGGHRAILRRINELAAQNGGESVVVTFAPHPRIVLGKADGLKLLNTLEEKIALLEEVGVDHLIVAPFTEEFSRLSSQEYVRDYLVERIGVHTLVVGYNHHFGHNKDGDFRFLQSMQAEYGFEVYEISRQQIDDEKVSSTVVRQLITAGDVAHAMRLLERPYILITNLKERAIDPYKLLPPNGRYRVEIEGQGAAVLMISHSGMNLDFASSYNLEKPLQIGFIDRIG
ncbi:MAG: FAD synthetase [Rikenellaceae bacterium]|nr:FAD synthetase [Rikenellaceae bacterium]